MRLAVVNTWLRSVVLRVFQRVHDQEVVYRIVRAVMVKVVDVLAWPERAADVLLHHVAMFKHVAFVLHRIRVRRHSQHDVAHRGVDIAARSTFHSLAVVARDESLWTTMFHCGELSTATFTWIRSLPGAFVVALYKPFPFLVAKIGAPSNRHAATASAWRCLSSMPAKHVGLAVTKKVFGGDQLAASTRTSNIVSHSFQYSRILG